MLTLEEFEKVDLRVGTILDASVNRKARKPAYKFKIDMGKELGIKKSSAQVTELYTPEELIGKQVVVVANFAPIKVSEVKSEVRILGAETENGIVLLDLERKVENGAKVD